MLMNSYIAAAVLAFCATQTGAAPVAVPPPELLAEKNIAFSGFDPSTWTPAKRDAEAQWNTANTDGSVPDSFMQAVNKWQKAKNGGSSRSKSKNDKRDAGLFVANPDGTLPPKSLEALDRWNKQFGGQKRDALSVAVNPDGSVDSKAQEAIDRWNAQFGARKRDPLMVVANEDGTISPEAQKALDRWNKQFGYPAEEKRDAMSIAVGPDGYIPPEVQEQLDRFDRQFGQPSKEKRDALSVAVDPEAGRISPESQAALDRWNKQFGYPAEEKRDAEEESKQNLPQGPGVLDLNNGEYRPLMIQRREAEAEADPQVFSGLPLANWFKQYKAAQSKNNKNNNIGKREAEAEAWSSSSGKSNYISIPANAWAAALKKQKGGE